jgi:hypothetical protein
VSGEGDEEYSYARARDGHTTVRWLPGRGPAGVMRSQTRVEAPVEACVGAPCPARARVWASHALEFRRLPCHRQRPVLRRHQASWHRGGTARCSTASVSFGAPIGSEGRDARASSCSAVLTTAPLPTLALHAARSNGLSATSRGGRCKATAPANAAGTYDLGGEQQIAGFPGKPMAGRRQSLPNPPRSLPAAPAGPWRWAKLDNFRFNPAKSDTDCRLQWHAKATRTKLKRDAGSHIQGITIERIPDAEHFDHKGSR